MNAQGCCGSVRGGMVHQQVEKSRVAQATPPMRCRFKHEVPLHIQSCNAPLLHATHVIRMAMKG